ncbi:hypothetical protein JCM5176_15810 [Streptococcus sobrinus]
MGSRFCTIALYEILCVIFEAENLVNYKGTLYMKFNFTNYENLSTKELSFIQGGDWRNELLNFLIETSMPIGWNWHQKK